MGCLVSASRLFVRLYEWKPNKHKDVRDVLQSQQHNTQVHK